MRPVLTPNEMAALDAAAPEPLDELIDRAGRAVARSAIQMLGGTYGRVVNVVAGKGNNGADGRVAAAVLRRRGVTVRVFDATAVPNELPTAHLVIDAAYGTGFRGTWTPPGVGSAPVLAVDVPSGVDARTGVAAGATMRANRTITFQALKPGLLVGDGAERAGRIDVADIGLRLPVVTQHLVEASDVASWWPARAVDAHKWRGAVHVVAGSVEMTGAARLCAEAAARSGAGLVKVSIPGAATSMTPEIVQQQLADGVWADDVLVDAQRFGSLAVGPGLGRSDATISSVAQVVANAPQPMVIDGDALFALNAGGNNPADVLSRRSAPTVVTPHDGEFRALTGKLPGADRVAAARHLAADLGVTVLLKGPTTVVADPDGEVLLIDNGDQRLATAGTGDVLAGMVAAALATSQTLERSSFRAAAAAAAWLHADAANRRAPDGFLAGDIIEALPAALADLRLLAYGC